MGWTYTSDLAARVSTTRYHAVIGYGSAADLYALRREMRRHMRLTTVYASIAGIDDPEPMADGRHRIAIVGLPYRAWTLRELVGQLRSLGLRVSVVLADTQTTTEAGLLWESLSAVFSDAIAVPAAQVGTGVLDAAAGAADVVESTGAGLREGLPAAGEGVEDLLAGAGNVIGSAGQGARTLGWFSTLSPTATAILVIAVVGVGFAMYTGALRFKPISVGGK